MAIASLSRRAAAMSTVERSEMRPSLLAAATISAPRRCAFLSATSAVCSSALLALASRARGPRSAGLSAGVGSFGSIVREEMGFGRKAKDTVTGSSRLRQGRRVGGGRGGGGRGHTLVVDGAPNAARGHAAANLRFARVGAMPQPAPRARVDLSLYWCPSSISRSRRSSCAASAYRWGRLGGPITDERLGVTFHYPKKRHVAFACLVGWAGDNASLWNKAEATERRRDSVVAREVQVAIPRELAPDSQIALAVAFATFLRETRGVAVDVAVHNPRARDGESQPHARLLMTTRRVADDGSFGEKTRELDSLKTRSASVEVIRSSWAAMCNTALEDARVRSA